MDGRVDRVIAWNKAPDRHVSMVIAVGWVAALPHQAHVWLSRVKIPLCVSFQKSSFDQNGVRERLSER